MDSTKAYCHHPLKRISTQQQHPQLFSLSLSFRLCLLVSCNSKRIIMTDRDFYYRIDDEQELLPPDGPPPPYRSGNMRSTKTLHARPTFWSPRQPPNRDWKTMAMRGKRLVNTLRQPSPTSADQHQHRPVSTLFDSPPAYEDITGNRGFNGHPMDPRAIRESLTNSAQHHHHRQSSALQQHFTTRPRRTSSASPAMTIPTVTSSSTRTRHHNDKCTIM